MSDTDNKELDEVLAKIDHRQAVQDLAASWGATYRQSKVFADSCADQFTTQSANLLFNGKAARTDESVKQHFQKEYSFLIPPDADVSRLNGFAVDPALADKAFIHGHMTSRVDVFKRLGRDQTKFDELARSYGLRDSRDTKTRGVRPGTDNTADDNKAKTPNPFADGSFNLTVIGRLVRSNPSLAASLAASAGKDISGRPLRRAS